MDELPKNIKFIEKNDELMITSEKRKENKYKDFNISKMQKILTIKTSIYFIDNIFILNDGRIIVYGSSEEFKNYLCYVFDIKNNIFFNIKLKDIEDIIQMDDGIVIIRTNSGEIILIDIKEQNYEIIKKEEINARKIIKLSNQKILVFEWEKINKYIYKNKIKNKKILIFL